MTFQDTVFAVAFGNCISIIFLIAAWLWAQIILDALRRRKPEKIIERIEAAKKEYPGLFGE